jgi:hypothetical protein
MHSATQEHASQRGAREHIHVAECPGSATGVDANQRVTRWILVRPDGQLLDQVIAIEPLAGPIVVLDCTHQFVPDLDVVECDGPPGQPQVCGRLERDRHALQRTRRANCSI